ncbi:uncharacterized protein EI90DRAFT_3023139 [Cantharellus anzutake]|uniref:uncharacterized protein n=1 Tax=Cantharellus anzutake TaxID=1750568 RepID=UPI0019081DAE|nr:uncharacterized protein EI90DRAFT_3023139 [Cantharellus anzutake]KAF8312169.1 hypothetical protein EI90DRAFT_3023139 [Cantharellus anzutake]
MPLSMLLNSERPSLPGSSRAGSGPGLGERDNLGTADPIAAASACVEEGLDALKSAGALHKRNRMSIAELVNNPLETTHINDVSDNDIFDAVSEAWEHGDKDLAGAHDADDSGDDTPVVSHQEALQAALLLMTYTKQIHSSFARKMEVILAPVWLRHTKPWPLPSRNLGPESEHSEIPDLLRYPDGPPTSRDMPLNHSSTHFIYWSHPTSFGYATPLSELPASFGDLPHVITY